MKVAVNPYDMIIIIRRFKGERKIKERKIANTLSFTIYVCASNKQINLFA